MPAECTVSIPLKRTAWFDATQHHPARDGDYEVRFRLDGSGEFCTPRRHRWSNGEWQFDLTKGRFGTVDGDQWRGLEADGSAVAGVAPAPEDLRFADMPKPLRDALLAYHARPCDQEAAAIVRAVLAAYGVSRIEGDTK